MKHVIIFGKVFFIVFFIGYVAHSSFARTLDVSELEYKGKKEDLVFELSLKNSHVGEALSLSMTCPPPVTVPCASQVPTDDFAFGLVTSSCPGTITVLNLGDAITNQICPNIYVITRTYQATDACSNTATCTQVITVLDNIPPIITCPSNITVNCDSQVPSPNTGTVLVIDCGISTTTFLGDVISNQTCASQYEIIRTYQVVDVCGNSASCTQLITVLDNTHPAITCPPNITLSCTEDTSPFNTGLATATDNCDQSPNIAYADMFIPGSCPNGGAIQRTWAVEDNCGNSSTCVQVITIVDIDPPVILSCPPSVTISCSDSTLPFNTGIASAVDDCDLTPAITYADMFIPGICVNGGSIDRTFIATDNCGNTSTCLQVISVVDNIPPVISNGPMDITVTASGPSPCSMYVSIGIPTATDNCDPNVLLSNDYNFTADASDVYSEGSTLVTFTATDECGNTSTHSFMVVVNCQPPAPCGIVVHSNCNVEISGYTRLGGGSEGAPYIKMKELPLTTTGSNNNSAVPIPHGLTASKIISVSVLVESAVDHLTPPEYSTAINLRYSFSVTPTDIVIQNNTLPGDCVICSKPAKVLIIYKE